MELEPEFACTADQNRFVKQEVSEELQEAIQHARQNEPSYDCDMEVEECRIAAILATCFPDTESIHVCVSEPTIPDESISARTSLVEATSGKNVVVQGIAEALSKEYDVRHFDATRALNEECTYDETVKGDHWFGMITL
jgi:hypothetical protein